MPVKHERPTCPDDIANRIIHYGRFKEELDYMVGLMKSDSSTSIVIRGNAGSGKKTLIKEAALLSDVITIYINPYHISDDYQAMKRIAMQLGLKPLPPSLQEIMADIEERSGILTNKIVIVLLYFEEFCRQKQSLLYCLTNLTQHGRNINLIGLTLSLGCTENLEKRVRSRVNALFHDLKMPYSDKDEYLEFASQLLGGYKIRGNFKDQLETMYLTGNHSVRRLKKHLITVCKWDENGVLQPAILPVVVNGIEEDVHSLSLRFGWLTKPQQDLLKLAVFCFNASNKTDITLRELGELALRYNCSEFNPESQSVIKDVAVLVKLSMLKPSKANLLIVPDATFTIGVSPGQLKKVIESNPHYHSIKTDSLWKRLRI